MPDPTGKSLSATQTPALWNRFLEVDGCWVWQGAKNTHGYGHLKYRGKYWQAHRLAFEIDRGPIGEGLVIDHLCRRRDCINPDHMEPVTNRENIQRGARALLFCGRGHARTPINTYVSKKGWSNCRVCHRDREMERRHARSI